MSKNLLWTVTQIWKIEIISDVDDGKAGKYFLIPYRGLADKLHSPLHDRFNVSCGVSNIFLLLLPRNSDWKTTSRLAVVLLFAAIITVHQSVAFQSNQSETFIIKFQGKPHVTTLLSQLVAKDFSNALCRCCVFIKRSQSESSQHKSAAIRSTSTYLPNRQLQSPSNSTYNFCHLVVQHHESRSLCRSLEIYYALS